MQGDFSNLDFDPHAHERGVAPAANGVLRNVNGVLHQQGRVSLDTDFTDGQLLELGWQAQAGRDVIGAGVCAVPADEADGFKVQSAAVVNGQVHVQLHPGRAWADGILARLAGAAADPAALVERTATYFGPPLSSDQVVRSMSAAAQLMSNVSAVYPTPLLRCGDGARRAVHNNEGLSRVADR